MTLLYPNPCYNAVCCKGLHCIYFCLFDFTLYIPVKNFALCHDRSSRVEPVLSKGLMCLAQGHNIVTPVRLEPTTPRS